MRERSPPIRGAQPARQKTARKIRADAQRNEQALLAAAATVFVTSGVEAPVRDIAAAAGVGMGTIYRHFPTRADLVVAVYRHQVEACAEAGEISADIDAYELMRAIGSLCIGADNDPRYDARRMVKLLITGLLQSRST